MTHTARLALALALLAAPAAAHDMWLVPPERATAGVSVDVVVGVGMDFPRSLSAIDPTRCTLRVRRAGFASEAVDVRTGLVRREDRRDTLARFTPSGGGLWTVAAETRPRLLPQAAADFNGYLLHDGLAHVYAERLAAGEQDEDAVERYSKYVKTLFAVEGPTEAARPGGGAGLAPLGLTLEIVPLENPLELPPRSTLPVRVLFRGEPLAGANLGWDLPGTGEGFVGSAWTDAEGEALVPLGRPGLVTLRLVHMTRPRHADYEWESFWASLTWRVPPPPR